MAPSKSEKIASVRGFVAVQGSQELIKAPAHDKPGPIESCEGGKGRVVTNTVQYISLLAQQIRTVPDVSTAKLFSTPYSAPGSPSDIILGVG